jgi:hypothetical protein
MEKRKTPYAEGLPKEKAISDVYIISEIDNQPQDIFWRTSPTSQLKHFIERGQLTDCLNLLESRGFCGETALFLLSDLQACGGAV